MDVTPFELGQVIAGFSSARDLAASADISAAITSLKGMLQTMSDKQTQEQADIQLMDADLITIKRIVQKQADDNAALKAAADASPGGTVSAAIQQRIDANHAYAQSLLAQINATASTSEKPASDASATTGTTSIAGAASSGGPLGTEVELPTS